MDEFKKGDTASWDARQVRRSQQQEERRPARKRRRRRINPVVYILMVLIISAMLAGVGWLLICDLCAFNSGPITQVTVEVSADDDMGDIAEKLEDAGLIKYKWFFRLFALVANADEKIGIGTYELNTDMDYRALIVGMELTVSKEDFKGGIRAVLRGRNILIDHAFKGALESEYQKFLFRGGEKLGYILFL